MKKPISWILILLLLILSGVWADRAVNPRNQADALPESTYHTSWALLVGVNKYPNLPAHLQLNYAVNDVTALKEVLIQQYQFPESNIVTLTNEQATKQHMIEALGTLADGRRVQGDDRILVYFSGHGQTVPLPGGGEMGFMLPYDAKVDLNDVTNFSAYYTTCVGMDELKRLGPGIPAKHVLFLVDAYYSGLAVSARGGLQPSIPDYLRKVASLRVRQVITAGLKGEQSYEKPEWGHGAFTYKLLEALKTGVADGNSDGVITALELAAHLQNVVPNIARQTPKFGYFEGEGEFLFLRSVDEPPEIQPPFRLEGEAIDLHPLQITLTSPSVRNGEQLTLERPSNGEILLQGKVTDDVGIASATLNEGKVVVRPDGSFAVPLVVEANRKYTLRFRAVDIARIDGIDGFFNPFILEIRT